LLPPFQYPLLGNYWSDYTAKYHNATEVGTSRVENATYIIDPNNQDKNPLVTLKSTENTIPELLSWNVASSNGFIYSSFNYLQTEAHSLV
jgi:hypothetical protein